MTKKLDLLPDVMSDSGFFDRLYRTARYTADTGLEAAFVVYGGDSTYDISHMVEGTKVYDPMDDVDHESVDVASLIYTVDQEVREDILLMLHSHPEGSPMPPQEAMVSDETYEDFYHRRGEFQHIHKLNLFPSDGDTRIYAHINERNPGHVSTILTTDAAVSLAGLMFYKHDVAGSPIVSPYNEHWSPSKGIMLARMSEAGFKFVEAEFDQALRTYSPAVDEILAQLA